MKKILVSLVFTAALCISAFMAGGVSAQPIFTDKVVKDYSAGVKAKYLSGAHVKEKMADCAGCHDSAMPSDGEKEINAKCVSCHGGLEEMAKNSQKPEFNAHKAHLGEINCTSCHAGHTPSVSYCNNCHAWKMDIPFEGPVNKNFVEDLKKYDKVKPVRTETVDVVIAGGGGSGIIAAIMAKEAGASVLILEKMAVPGGNTQLSAGGGNFAGTRFQKAQGIADNPEDFYKDIMAGGKNRNNPELARILANKSAESSEWLISKGVSLSHVGKGAASSFARMHSPEGGAVNGPYMINNLKKVLADKGVELRVNSKVVKVLTDKTGAVTGVLVKGKHSGIYEIKAKSVILATGGFGANPEMVAKYRPDFKGMASSNQPGNVGDGVLLGEYLGAAMVDIDQIQANPTLAYGSQVVISEIVRGAGAIFVNQSGKRFASELLTRDVSSAKILAEKGGYAYEIFDKGVYDRVKQIAAYEHLGLVENAMTLEELAKKVNIDPATLKATVATYNQYVDAGKDKDFERSELKYKVVEGPFYALKVTPGVHYTMGGLKIDANAQVYNTKGKPMKNLYASGEVTGGVHGANRLGGNSISETVTFGRIAGESAAKNVKTK